LIARRCHFFTGLFLDLVVFFGLNVNRPSTALSNERGICIPCGDYFTSLFGIGVPLISGFSVITANGNGFLTAIVLARRLYPLGRWWAKMTKRRKRLHYQTQFRTDDTGAFVFPGADGRIDGSVPAWHRENVRDYTPYCIPNELICGKLGAFLGLPVPPFAITYFNKTPYFSQLNFNSNKDELPAVEAEICVKSLPDLCTGILLFDILIANEDRHDENVAVDSITKPTQIMVYDHEQALFGGGGNLIGIPRLDKLRERLGMSGGSVTGGNACCFLHTLNTVQYFGKWRGRIWDIPDWFIGVTCDDAIGLGITQQEANKAKDFLIYRKNNLSRIIKDHAKTIPLFDEWRPKHDLFGPE
jgi:hypothetical protein